MIKTSISEGNGGSIASVVKRQSIGHGHKSPPGLSTYTLPYALERNRAMSAVSTSGSNDMAINGSTAGGTPDRVHDGTDSLLWAGSNLAGTNFVFDTTDQAQAGTKSIDGTATVNNDQALLTRTSAITITDYTALTGWVYITSWPSSGTKDVRIKDRKSTRLNSSHSQQSRMPSSA